MNFVMFIIGILQNNYSYNEKKSTKYFVVSFITDIY
jgi:riboflavin transporter FmnP